MIPDPSDLDEALRYLDDHINLEATAGRVEGLSLDRMRRFVDIMGDPQRAYPVVHVTGTNGKGSTSLILTQLLRAQGLRVGTYMSPHVERINERIRIDGEPLGDEEMAAAIGEVARVEPLLGERPSYFEVLTAAALNWFAAVAVDVAVVEVGLLGRFDATNVVDGQVAVVTNVRRDHTDGRGDWRRQVAWEKAGIVKPGATLVLGEVDEEVREVFAAEAAARTLVRGVDFDCTANRLAVGGRVVDVAGPHGFYEQVALPLHGAHQGDNAALAVAAAEALLDAPLAPGVVPEAFAAVEVPGRFEVVRHHPLVVLDAAHNPEGARATIATFEEAFAQIGSRILVVGMLTGRDPEAVLEALDARAADVVIACAPAWPRAVPAAELAAVARRAGIEVEEVPGVADALRRALAVCSEHDAVLVTGSFHVVGAARRVLRARS